MERAYRYLFWGYLVTFINFEINGQQILPNFIGWIIVFYGITQLNNLHTHKYYKIFTIIVSGLVGLTLMNEYLFLRIQNDTIFIYCSFIVFILIFVFNYCLFTWIEQIYTKNGQSDKAKSTSRFTYGYLVFDTVLILLSCLYIITGDVRIHSTAIVLGFLINICILKRLSKYRWMPMISFQNSYKKEH